MQRPQTSGTAICSRQTSTGATSNFGKLAAAGAMSAAVAAGEAYFADTGAVDTCSGLGRVLSDIHGSPIAKYGKPGSVAAGAMLQVSRAEDAKTFTATGSAAGLAIHCSHTPGSAICSRHTSTGEKYRSSGSCAAGALMQVSSAANANTFTAAGSACGLAIQSSLAAGSGASSLKGSMGTTSNFGRRAAPDGRSAVVAAGEAYFAATGAVDTCKGRARSARDNNGEATCALSSGAITGIDAGTCCVAAMAKTIDSTAAG